MGNHYSLLSLCGPSTLYYALLTVSQASVTLSHPYQTPLTFFVSLCGPSPPLSCTTHSDESSSLTQPSIMHHLKSSWVSANGILPTLFHAPLKVFLSLCVPSLYPLPCTSHSLPESLCTLPVSSIMHFSQSSRVSWTHSNTWCLEYQILSWRLISQQYNSYNISTPNDFIMSTQVKCVLQHQKLVNLPSIVLHHLKIAVALHLKISVTMNRFQW